MNLTDELVLELLNKKDIPTRNKIAVEFIPFLNNKVQFFCREKRCKKLQDDLFSICQENILYYILAFDATKVSDKLKEKASIHKIFFSFVNYKISYLLLEQLRVDRNSHHGLIENKIKKFKTDYFKFHGFYPSNQEIIDKFNIKRTKILNFSPTVTSLEAITTSKDKLNKLIKTKTYDRALNSKITPSSNIEIAELFDNLIKGYSVRTKSILTDKYINGFLNLDLVEKYKISLEALDSLLLQFKDSCGKYLEKDK